MKMPLLFLLATFPFSIHAQITAGHPCQEFEQKLNSAEAQVRDFDREMKKHESKLRQLDDQISLRSQNINALISQRDNLNDRIRTLPAEQAALRQDVSRLQLDSSNLRSNINQKESLRQHHAAQANATTNLELKREHLRLSKQLEKEVESLRAQLSSLDQTIASSNQRIKQIDVQIQQQTQLIADINRQIEQAQRDPALQRLQQERSEALNVLSNAQVNLDRLQDQVAKASSHVNMCHGYLELSVKYPAALRISKQLVKQGCSKYRQTNQGSELENEAQQELLASACR